MQDAEIVLNACLIAFGAVFVLLTFLALVMWLLTQVFRERQSAVDPAIAAAIAVAVTTAYPGARVTRIEEKEKT